MRLTYKHQNQRSVPFGLDTIGLSLPIAVAFATRRDLDLHVVRCFDHVRALAHVRHAAHRHDVSTPERDLPNVAERRHVVVAAERHFGFRGLLRRGLVPIRSDVRSLPLGLGVPRDAAPIAHGDHPVAQHICQCGNMQFPNIPGTASRTRFVGLWAWTGAYRGGVISIWRNVVWSQCTSPHDWREWRRRGSSAP